MHFASFFGPNLQFIHGSSCFSPPVSSKYKRRAVLNIDGHHR